jgi:2,4-didehydro-3-deoxy-L-rhamnonate hydrolase
MKLLRVGPAGLERPAVAVDGGFVDVSDVVADYDGPFLAAEELPRLRTAIAGRAADGAVPLRPGDVIELGITGLGRQRQNVVSAT